MKKSVAMKWVKALRSGKYEQGTGALQKDNKYCCLGVLCDIAPVEKSLLNKILLGGTLYDHPAVRQWAQVKISCGAFLGTSLVTANDEEQLTFDEIADLIQINWELL